MRWSVNTILVVLALIFAVLSAFTPVPLWVAVLLLALALLVPQGTVTRI